MAGRVFVAGSANMDLVAAVPRLPGPGETVLASALQTLPGGKGANQAIAAAKAGSPATFFGCVGSDALGDRLMAFLGQAGVELAWLDRSSMPTGTALIAVDVHGQNQISIYPGANSSLRFSEGFRTATRGDVLLCQNECPLDVVFEYMQAAHRQHVTTILNAAPAVELPDGLLALVDVLIVNEEEALGYRARSRAAAPPPADGVALARDLQVRAQQIVMVTLGDKGVAAVVGDRAMRISGHKVNVVDTTGAGDCFCGYLAASIAQGQSIDEGIALANAASALAVQSQGAAAAIPQRARVLDFLESCR